MVLAGLVGSKGRRDRAPGWSVNSSQLRSTGQAGSLDMMGELACTLLGQQRIHDLVELT